MEFFSAQIINYMDRPARDQQREKAKQKALGLTDEEICERRNHIMMRGLRYQREF